MFQHEKLTDVERGIIKVFYQGAGADLRARKLSLNDPAKGESWGVNRTVSAELIVALLTGELVPENSKWRGVTLRGARITGHLRLATEKLVCRLELQDCFVEEVINLYGATASYVGFPGCHVPELDASHMETSLDLDLSRGFTAGGVSLSCAKIGGNLHLGGARLSPDRDGRAFIGDGIEVVQSMFCDDGLSAQGEFRLPGACIGGRLDLSSARLANPNGPALIGDSMVVKEDLHARDSFSVQGEVHIPDASIGGQVDLRSAHIANPDGVALRATGISVGGSFHARDGFIAEGGVGLGQAHIGGECNLSGARLTVKDGIALHADRLHVDETLTCANGFTAEGEVRLVGARIGGQFNLRAAHLESSAEFALAADRLEVALDVIASEDFTAHGEIRLPSARIGGHLDFREATLNAPDGTALQLGGASSETLFMPKQRPQGEVDLSNATVGAFYDYPAGWPAPLRLRGFVYDTLENDEVEVKERLRWLTASADSYSPQIYDQLAATYTSAGQDEAARTVMIAKQRRRRTVLNPPGKLANLVLDWTVGYGYRTWQAGVWLVVLVSLSAWAFTRIHMVATTQHPVAFNPAGYALDLLVPVADLGLKNDWQPSEDFMYLTWLLRGMGWILTTAVIAAVTGVLKRD